MVVEREDWGIREEYNVQGPAKHGRRYIFDIK